MKDFILFIRTQGVVGLAVGFILGKAVSDVVGSIVSDLINPLVGLLIGNLGTLSKAYVDFFGAHIMYGNFLSILLNFVIVAGVVYFGIKRLGLEKIDAPKV